MMVVPANPTAKQIKILDYFVEITAKRYCPPSIKEMARHFGHKIDIVHWYLSRLQHYGYVDKPEPGRWMMTEKCMKCYGVLTFEQIKELKNSSVIAAERWNIMKNIDKYKIEEAAIAAHEMNKKYCELIGDASQKSWRQAEQWQRESAISGVKFLIEKPNAPESSQHDAWVKDKVKDGWTFGEEKCPLKKTHPCIVLYNELPQSQKSKDAIFQATVKGVLSQM